MKSALFFSIDGKSIVVYFECLRASGTDPFVRIEITQIQEGPPLLAQLWDESCRGILWIWLWQLVPRGYHRVEDRKGFLI